MGSYGQADGMERKELSLFTRIRPPFPFRLILISLDIKGIRLYAS